MCIVMATNTLRICRTANSFSFPARAPLGSAFLREVRGQKAVFAAACFAAGG